jgi:trans-aconitate methyltransferase
MTAKDEFGMVYARSQIKRQQNPFRKLIKSIYVSRVLQQVNGPTVDLGCGAGQILERLPAGSIGIEVNPFLIEHLTRRGLRAMRAFESQGEFDLRSLRPNEFKTLVLSHVLEHFNDAHKVLGRLLHDCADLGVSTVIIVVPGETGYHSDPTHKTFIDIEYLRAHEMIECEGFEITGYSYFPGNLRFIGKLFVYHELMIVYRAAARSP